MTSLTRLPRTTLLVAISIVIAIAFAVLAFGGGAVLTCLVFWSTLPFALGIAAIVAAFVLCIIG